VHLSLPGTKNHNNNNNKRAKGRAIADLLADCLLCLTQADEKPSQINPYPSEFDKKGCNQNGKTCPVASIMVAWSEKAK
jgi:hypothetical protein